MSQRNESTTKSFSFERRTQQSGSNPKVCLSSQTSETVITGLSFSSRSMAGKPILNGRDSVRKVLDIFRQKGGQWAQIAENYFGLVIENFECEQSIYTAVEVTAGNRYVVVSTWSTRNFFMWPTCDFSQFTWCLSDCFTISSNQTKSAPPSSKR